MHTLLIIDDDVELCEMLEAYLHTEGFLVASAHTPQTGSEEALSGKYALVILDVMLPGEIGFEVLKRIRARSRVPVLMLTARGDEVDRIVGLEVGADDYLPKPFNARELVARIRAILRRTEKPDDLLPGEQAKLLVVGDVRMDLGARRIHLNERQVELTSAEFDLLRLLLDAAGNTVSRAEISRIVLDRRLHPTDRSIDVHVSSLRRKLGHRQGDVERIRTIRGTGYLYSRPSEAS